ncbi:hypothetical protein RXV95_03235 [Novosphingobium sp. ZN18A2]
MTPRKQNDGQNTRSRYVRPELTVFGSVRNLTGGSSGDLGDGNVAKRGPK